MADDVTDVEVPLEGVSISPLGLGSWAMGGSGYPASLGAQRDEDSLTTIRAAVAAGIDWIDTAPYYGLGRAEELIGRYLAAVPDRERPLVFTKCGIVWRSAHKQPTEVLTPENLHRECEASLRRLGVERLDLLQIHWPATDGTPIEDSWVTLAELVDEGKVRWIGVSNFDVELLDRCERIRHVDTLQPPLSLLRRTAAADLLPWCCRHGTAVLVYSPLESGMLAGSYDAERVAALAEDDVRMERTDVFGRGAVERNLSFVERLRTIAAEHGWTVPELAAAWVLSWPGVTGAILGARTPAQLAQWSGAASLRLDEATLDAVADALTATGAGTGPLRPGREP